MKGSYAQNVHAYLLYILLGFGYALECTCIFACFVNSTKYAQSLSSIKILR
jgi:hypothetical protein